MDFQSRGFSFSGLESKCSAMNIEFQPKFFVNVSTLNQIPANDEIFVLSIHVVSPLCSPLRSRDGLREDNRSFCSMSPSVACDLSFNYKPHVVGK